MKIKVGISNRHVHLSEEDYKILFEEEMTKRNDLVQPNEFASNQVVTLIGPKDKIENVRVLGPNRPYTQVEVSKTDTYKLGIEAYPSTSGCFDRASEITIKTEKGSITKKCAILATRHIHINKEDLKKYNLDENKLYKVKINTEKGATLENVHLKAKENAVLELHLDTDDANSTLLNPKDEVELIDE